MLIYNTYSLVYSHPVFSFLVFVIAIGCFLYFWKRSSPKVKKLLLGLVIIPVLLLVGVFLASIKPQSSSDLISASDYMGGCVPERYINGDCMFDSVKRVHANFYPLVTEDDGVWKRLESYSKEDLMKTAEQELEKLKKGQYKGQQEQVARVQSFIDILSRR